MNKVIEPKLTIAQRVQIAMDRLGGKASSEELLAYAKPENSPIHDIFDWDDSKAAHQHRLSQARHYIRLVEITYADLPAQEPRVLAVSRGRAFVACDSPGSRGMKTYEPISEVIKDEGKMAQLVAECEVNMKSWMRKYETYRSLQGFVRLEPVFAAIESISGPRSK